MRTEDSPIATNAQSSGAPNELSLAAWTEHIETPVDATSELEAVTASMLALRLDPYAPDAPQSSLVSLHGALLLFQLGGRAELLPSVGLFAFGRRLLERRIVASAHRLSRHGLSAGDAYDAWVRSARHIEELIGLIDPELRDSIAA